jgi:hypothetical protein
LQVWTASPRHCVSPAAQVPQVLLLAKQAGVAPLHVVTTVQAVPSGLHCSTLWPLQRLSPGVQATHFPWKQAAFGATQGS